MNRLAPRRELPVAAWPELDRRLWTTAQDSAYVATLRPTTLAIIAKNYGRWISVLTSRGHLDERTHPADRVTPETVRAYRDQLRELGNQDRTIEGRLDGLAAALRVMAPERSFVRLQISEYLRDDADQSPPSNGDDAHLSGWPPGDLQLWKAGLQPGDILDGPRYASRLRPDTILAIAAGYRRWLVFLRAHGRLDLMLTPASRVTRENVADYVRISRGDLCNRSLIARLSELRRAMRIMHPDFDFRWLTSPGGRSLESLLPVTTRPMQIIDSKVLYEWGHTIIREALAEPHPDRRRIGYRDGLLIALFAARAPRVRSMASLRLDKTVIRNGDTSYRLVFEKADVKTSRRIEYDAPEGLSSAIDRYIAVERVELLAGQTHDSFWVNKYGEPLSANNISDMIRVRSGRAFGKAFGPHRFRHAIGTTAPLKDPAHPGVAAAVLGISGHMVEEHYNRATQADVAMRFHATLSEQRAGLQSLARRGFRQRRES
jgi:hypothetical protein